MADTDFDPMAETRWQIDKGMQVFFWEFGRDMHLTGPDENDAAILEIHLDRGTASCE